MIGWIENLNWLYKPAALAMQSRIREYKYLHEEYLHICCELRTYTRTSYKKDYYLLRSIPGVRPFIAIVMLAEIGDLRRFKGIDRLSSYIGLVPSLHSSEEKTFSKGITMRSRHLLRSYLIEGAWMAARKDPELMLYYQERNASNHKKLVIKIASKTLSRM